MPCAVHTQGTPQVIASKANQHTQLSKQNFANSRQAQLLKLLSVKLKFVKNVLLIWSRIRSEHFSRAKVRLNKIDT